MTPLIVQSLVDRLCTPDSPYSQSAPSTEGELQRLDSMLPERLPPQLKSFFEATDGLYNRNGQWFQVWPLRQVLEAIEGRYYRFDDGGLPDDWLPIGDDGAGDPYCIHLTTDRVMFWSTLDGEGLPVADNLADFLTYLSAA